MFFKLVLPGFFR